jgi:hypothetical protein
VHFSLVAAATFPSFAQAKGFLSESKSPKKRNLASIFLANNEVNMKDTSLKIGELQIKAAVIDELIDHGWVNSDSVIVSEMPVAGWSRRADLVLANGHLFAVEIKSDVDRLDRLVAQVETYMKNFEAVAVVAGKRHADTVLEVVPKNVGVFVAEMIEGKIKITQRQKPHLALLQREAALKHMTLPDLIRMLRVNEVKTINRDRHSVETLARQLPDTKLREGAIEAIKRRYRNHYLDFTSARQSDADTINAMPKLRKPKWAA